MTRLWQEKSGNPRIALPLILFGKFHVSGHSYGQTIPNSPTAMGAPLLPGGAWRSEA